MGVVCIDSTKLTINCICDMTELVLKRNVFEFNKEYFIQTNGTAIGTKLAPGALFVVLM